MAVQILTRPQQGAVFVGDRFGRGLVGQAQVGPIGNARSESDQLGGFQPLGRDEHPGRESRLDSGGAGDVLDGGDDLEAALAQHQGVADGGPQAGQQRRIDDGPATTRQLLPAVGRAGYDLPVERIRALYRIDPGEPRSFGSRHVSHGVEVSATSHDIGDGQIALAALAQLGERLVGDGVDQRLEAR